MRLPSESRRTQDAARQLGNRPKLRCRWQRAQVVTKVGRAEGARDPELRALRAANKRETQQLDPLKSFGQLQPADPVST